MAVQPYLYQDALTCTWCHGAAGCDSWRRYSKSGRFAGVLLNAYHKTLDTAQMVVPLSIFFLRYTISLLCSLCNRCGRGERDEAAFRRRWMCVGCALDVYVGRVCL